MPDSDSEIIGEKALRYKRNVLVISFVLIVVQVIPGLDITKIMLFGASLDNVSGGEYWALGIGYLFLIYNATAYAYYGWEDYVGWKIATIDRDDTKDIRLISIEHEDGSELDFESVAGFKTYKCTHQEPYEQVDNQRRDYFIKYHFDAEDSPQKTFEVRNLKREAVRRLLKITNRMEIWFPATVMVLAIIVLFTKAYIVGVHGYSKHYPIVFDCVGTNAIHEVLNDEYATTTYEPKMTVQVILDLSNRILEYDDHKENNGLFENRIEIGNLKIESDNQPIHVEPIRYRFDLNRYNLTLKLVKDTLVEGESRERARL